MDLALRIASLLGIAMVLVMGTVGLVRVRAVADRAAISPNAPEAVTNLRAVFGGIFVGMGLAPLILGSAIAYLTVAIILGVALLTKILGVVIDRPALRSVTIGILFDAFGVAFFVCGYLVSR